MAKLDVTYQVAPAGASAKALDEYVVEAVDGERVGKVQTILEGDEGMLLAIETGTPPFRHQVHVVPFDRIVAVDPETLSVRLRLRPEEIEETPELDPALGVENEDADLRRVKRLPPEFKGSVRPGGRDRGPVDRTELYFSIAIGLLGVFSFFALIVIAGRIDMTWHFALFAIPVVLLGISGLLAYTVFRNPTKR